MAQKSVSDELELFRQYLRSDSNENAKTPLLHPLFQKLFGYKFRIESDVHGADVYVAGQLIVESKTSHDQWLEGFYQALHYQKKYGLAYNTIMVVAHKFCAIWKVDKLPETAVIYHHTANAQTSPSAVGKENAKKTQNHLKIEIKDSAFYWLDPNALKGDIFAGAKNVTTESYEILKILRNLDSDRLQVNTHNFIQAIERMKPMFENPIDAVHCFYTIVAYWDITSTVTERPNGKISVTGFKGQKGSEDIAISPRRISDLKKFIETQYIFTNEGSGLTVDYYFSRFDEVLAKIDPEYVKQHGIFFTNDNLSKFALWTVKESFADHLDENYIVLDPAGGSGNLISSWRGKLKHKIISELQPDLLQIIERRMQVDPWHIEKGFTIIPRTSENKGLNFLDCSAEKYLDELKKELKLKNISFDKPIAFLLNPPYKNTDENVNARESTGSEYEIDQSILDLTGPDAGKERYLAFLGQILNISKLQALEHKDLHPVVMIFTPTSWLIPRPTYIGFRKKWDQHFKFHSGFIITSNVWFKLDGKWPLAFTIWTYNYNEEGNENTVKVLDLTHLEKPEVNLAWNADDVVIRNELKNLLSGSQTINLSQKRESIKDWCGQSMYDFKRDATKTEIESRQIFGGLPIKDFRRTNKKTYGTSGSSFVGFMDDITPVRVSAKDNKRFKNNPNVWFRLDSVFKDINKTKCFSGPTDNRSYCSYDIQSAKATFNWFTITKALNGVYPVWANQYDIWVPQITKELDDYYYSLCFAFVLAENRCVVTKFEKDNPVKGAPEVFVDNPLCPANPESFWSTTLEPFIEGGYADSQGGSSATPRNDNAALQLIAKIKELYRYWNLNYCKGQVLQNAGLQEEPYFRYFDYPDFLTPYSGLVQIRKYAEIHGKEDLQNLFKEISILTKKVKEEIYRLLVEEFRYFE
jgi:hypothetical protein